jgi:hypothetical protein
MKARPVAGRAERGGGFRCSRAAIFTFGASDKIDYSVKLVVDKAMALARPSARNKCATRKPIKVKVVGPLTAALIYRDGGSTTDDQLH